MRIMLDVQAASRENTLTPLIMGVSMKAFETPAAKREFQLKTKQVSFLEQQLIRGVIQDSPLKAIEFKPEGTKQYVVESARKNADGQVIGDGRVVTAETYAKEAEGKYIIDPADGETVLNNPRSAGACFIAGTLVHTDKGLVPIETLRIGDMVLSQPEMKGEQAYKRVVKTFSIVDKDVYLLMYATQDKVDQLVATDNHPFWVKDRGWVQASLVNEGDHIELPDGSYASVFCVKPIFRTETQDTGWVQGKYGRHNDFTGDLVDLSGDAITFGEEGVSNGELSSKKGDPRLKRRVFNIEVEDFHTYYVGDLGVWVHNTNCGGEGVNPENPNIDLRPGAETKLPEFVREQFQEKALDSFRRASEALEQNPGRSHIVEFETQSPFNTAARFFSEVVAKEGYADNIMLRLRGEDYLTRETALRGSEPVLTFDRAGNPIRVENPVFKRASEGPRPQLDVANEFTRPPTFNKTEYEAACFTGETYVTVEGGRLEEIQYIDRGQRVLSRCEKTGEVAYREVVQCFFHQNIPTYYLFYYKNDSKKAEIALDTTAEHPFWVKGKGWTPVRDLLPGDIIESFDGSKMTVDSVRASGSTRDVYNLEVAEFHTYFVGAGGLWVHNTKRTPVNATELTQTSGSAGPFKNEWTPDKSTLSQKLEDLQKDPTNNYNAIIKIQSQLGELAGSQAMARAGLENVFLPAASDLPKFQNILGKEDLSGKLLGVEVIWDRPRSILEDSFLEIRIPTGLQADHCIVVGTPASGKRPVNGRGPRLLFSKAGPDIALFVLSIIAVRAIGFRKRDHADCAGSDSCA